MANLDSVALVGVTGGAGTTRLSVELATALALDDRSVAVLDAAFATQGLAAYLDGRLEPDLTGLLTDRADEPLSAGLVEQEVEGDGRLAFCAAHAPFERLARAKTAEAAEMFEARVAAATETFDHVLVDTPPVASNQAIAAVNACSQTALVAPASVRGADAIQRMRSRLTDLGVDTSAVVSTRGELDAADVSLPETDADVEAAPTCVTDKPYATAVARVGEMLFEESLAVPSDGGLLGPVGSVLR